MFKCYKLCAKIFDVILAAMLSFTGCNTKSNPIIDTFTTCDDFTKKIYADDIINGLKQSPEFGYSIEMLDNAKISKGIRVIHIKDDILTVGE